MNIEQKDKSIIENLPLPVVVYRGTGEIMYCNQSLKTLCQKPDIQNIAQLIKALFGDMPAPSDFNINWDKAHEIINTGLKTTYTFKQFLVKSGNKNIPYEFIIIKSCEKFILVIEDISNVNQTFLEDKYTYNIKNNALVDSEKRMSAIFDLAPVVMLLLNDKREILQINKRGLQVLKKTKEHIVEKAFGRVYRCMSSFENPNGCGSGNNCSQCVIRNTILDTFKTGKQHFKVDVKIETMHGIRNLLLSTDLLYYENRKEVLATIDDITSQKQIETELKVAKDKAEESDRLKTAFLQNMSHEVRTPLNGILGFSSLLNTPGLTKEEKDYYISVVNESSNQLLSIVDNIINVARLEAETESVTKKDVNLNKIVDEIFVGYSQKANDKQLKFDINKGLKDNASVVHSDSDKLKLVLENLVDNAIKFTHTGSVNFNYTVEDENVIFSIKDSGIGITKDNWEKIYDRFYQVDQDSTRTYGGTGLGLAVAKGNIDLLGGRIWLDSYPGQGSVFYVSIPYHPVHQDIIHAEKTTKTDIDSSNPVILVAEDEEINYMFIEEALKDVPISLIHANNGQEAVELCQDRDDVTLVLMDIKMPVMDGYTALGEIKKLNPKLPIVAQTAYAFFSDKAKALKSGFDDYISKPIKSKHSVWCI